VNRELFQKINEVIETPEGVLSGNFAMDTWEDGHAECGTTRCVAGWAIHLTTNAPLHAGTGFHPSVTRLAESMGLQQVDFEEMGARLLDLTKSDRWLFYTDVLTAADFVRRAARGDECGARALYDE